MSVKALIGTFYKCILRMTYSAKYRCPLYLVGWAGLLDGGWWWLGAGGWTSPASVGDVEWAEDWGPAATRTQHLPGRGRSLHQPSRQPTRKTWTQHLEKIFNNTWKNICNLTSPREKSNIIEVGLLQQNCTRREVEEGRREESSRDRAWL